MKIVFMCVTLIGLAYSQSAGMFANPGESLIGIEGQYDSEDGDGSTVSTTSIGGSYVLNGNLEVAVLYDMTKVADDVDSDFDFDVDGLTYGGYYHLKASESLPVNVKVGGYYGEAKASADWLDELEWELESNGTAMGGGVYKNIYQKDAMNIIGHFNFHSITTEATISDSYGDSETTDDDFNSTSFGLAVRSGNLFVSPSIGRVDGESSFNVSFGYLLPQ